MKRFYKTEILWKKNVRSFIDFFVDLYARFFIKVDESNQVTSPEKILFVTLAQLGDALACSFVFPFIHERYPDAQIDVLTAEWNKPIFENNPFVRKIIFFNHFRMNRAKISLLKKIQIHIKTFRSTLKTIRSQHYDLSIEGGITHPNGNILCYRGRVKRRIGSGSGGYGSLLTDEVSLPTKHHFHILEAVLKILNKIEIKKQLKEIKPYFNTSKRELNQNHPSINYINSSFIIIQPESGNIKRTLSKEFWMKISEQILTSTNYFIIICGTSDKSSELSNYLAASQFNKSNRIIDAVKKFSLEEFFLFSKSAKAAFTVESLPAHLCSINCKTVSFYNNGSGVFFFPIPKERTIVIHNHFPSKDVKIHSEIVSYYVENMESKKTYELVEGFLKNLLA